jgi:hypothetical protein
MNNSIPLGHLPTLSAIDKRPLADGSILPPGVGSVCNHDHRAPAVTPLVLIDDLTPNAWSSSPDRSPCRAGSATVTISAVVAALRRLAEIDKAKRWRTARPGDLSGRLRAGH